MALDWFDFLSPRRKPPEVPSLPPEAGPVSGRAVRPVDGPLPRRPNPAAGGDLIGPLADFLGAVAGGIGTGVGEWLGAPTGSTMGLTAEETAQAYATGELPPGAVWTDTGPVSLVPRERTRGEDIGAIGGYPLTQVIGAVPGRAGTLREGLREMGRLGPYGETLGLAAGKAGKAKRAVKPTEGLAEDVARVAERPVDAVRPVEPLEAPLLEMAPGTSVQVGLPGIGPESAQGQMFGEFGMESAALRRAEAARKAEEAAAAKARGGPLPGQTEMGIGEVPETPLSSAMQSRIAEMEAGQAAARAEGKAPEILRPPEVGITPAEATSTAKLPEDAFPVQRVPISKIEVHPEEMQFKLGITERGIQPGSEIKGKWDPLAAGNLLLWERNDGSLWLVHGHHRIASAQDQGVKVVNAQVIKEADGYTMNEARAIGAEANIKDGKGTIYDHATYFRFGTRIPEEVASQRGVAGRGFTIGRSADDNTWAAFLNQKITPEQAEAIAGAAPGKSSAQVAGVSYALKNPKAPGDELRQFVRVLTAHEPTVKPVQGNLFGYDDSALQESETIAKYISGRVSDLRKEIYALRSPANRADMLKQYGVSVDDPAALTGVIAEKNAEITRLEQSIFDPDAYATLRRDAGLPETPTVTTREVPPIPPKPPTTSDRQSLLPDVAYRTPVVAGFEAQARSQSAGLPSGTFYALDRPFASPYHDVSQARQVPTPTVRNTFDPDGLLSVANKPLHRQVDQEVVDELNRMSIRTTAEGQDAYAEILRRRNFDSYIRGIDGDPTNRELIVLEVRPERGGGLPPIPPKPPTATAAGAVPEEPIPPGLPTEEDIARRTEDAYQRFRQGMEDDLRRRMEELKKRFPEQGGPEAPPVVLPKAEPQGKTPAGMSLEPTSLPRELAGAKPRYSIGSTHYVLEFESDIDKALLIVAQTKPSARDADYVAWLQTVFPDKSAGELRQMGKQVKARVKRLAQSQASGGRLRIPPAGDTAERVGAGIPPVTPPPPRGPLVPPPGGIPAGPSGPQMGLSQAVGQPPGPIPSVPLRAQLTPPPGGGSPVPPFRAGGTQPGLVAPPPTGAGAAVPPSRVVPPGPPAVPPPAARPEMDKILAIAKEQVRQDKPGALTRFLQRVPGIKQAVQFERPGLKMVGPSEPVLVAHIAETAARSQVSAQAMSSRLPLLEDLARSFGEKALHGGKVNVPFLGTAQEAASPITGTLKDIADNPQLYQLSPAQQASLGAMDARNTALLLHVTAGYGAKIGQYPSRPGGAYLPNVDKGEDLLAEIERESRNVARGVGQPRTWPTARDRMTPGLRPSFDPELDVVKLVEGADDFKTSAAGGTTYREAVGGKTKLEVLEETHPALFRKMMSLRKRLTSLQGTAGRIDANIHRAINDFLVTPTDGADYLGNVRAALDIRLRGGPQRGADLTRVQREMDGVRAQIQALKPAWDAANPKPYKFVQEGIYRYFPAEQAALIVESRKVTNNAVLKLIEGWRGQAFSGDFSPFAIQDVAGILADPPGSLRAGAGMVGKAAQTGDWLRSVKVSALAKDIADNPADWTEFAAIMGRSMRGTPAEFMSGFLSKVPGFDRFTEGTYVTVTRSTKALYDRAWRDLARTGVPELEAKVAAGTAAQQIFPLVSPARLGQSQARAAALRALPTSYSFIRQPASIMAKAATGYVNLGLRRQLTPQESLSARLMATMAASVLTASATSAAISAQQHGGDVQQAILDAINPDPNNGKFASLVFGDRRVPLGGPYRGIFRAIFPKEVEGVPVPIPFAGIKDFAQNRITPAVRTQLALLQNKDFYGNSILKGKMPEQILRFLAYEAEGALPLTAGAVVEGVRTGREDTQQQVIGQFVGVNVVSRSRLAEMKDKLAGGQKGSWDDLMAKEQQGLRRQHPELVKAEDDDKRASGSFADYAGEYFTKLYSHGRDIRDRLSPNAQAVLDQADIDLSLSRTLTLKGDQFYYLNDTRWKAYQDLVVAGLSQRLGGTKPLVPNASATLKAQREKTIRDAITKAKNAAEIVANTPMSKLGGKSGSKLQIAPQPRWGSNWELITPPAAPQGAR